jgi:hypothetical protein
VGIGQRKRRVISNEILPGLAAPRSALALGCTGPNAKKASPVKDWLSSVRSERLELSHLAELPPEDSASTNFATSAAFSQPLPQLVGLFGGAKIRGQFSPKQEGATFFYLAAAAHEVEKLSFNHLPMNIFLTIR